MSKILFCAVDTGANEALSPVAQLLQTKGHEIVWMNESRTLHSVQPDVVVAGVGSQRDLTLVITQKAVSVGIPVVKVLDFFGTGMPQEKGVMSTRLCVLDEMSRRREASLRGMLLDDVIATGGPQFDALISVEPLYSALFNHNRKFILVVLPSTAERAEELCIPLAPILSEFDSFTVGVLCHPKLAEDDYNTILNLLGGSAPHHLYITDKELRNEGRVPRLVATADLVLGTTSTLILTACYVRSPVVSYVPYGGPNHRMLMDRGVCEMPPARVGAALHAGSPEELCFIMEQLLSPDGDTRGQHIRQNMETAQRKFYKLDGKNTARVVAVVESLV